MLNSLISLCFVTLFCVSAAAASRTKIYSINGHEGKFVSSPPAADGICRSMVQSQGYICHEHTVPNWDQCFNILFNSIKFLRLIVI